MKVAAALLVIGGLGFSATMATIVDTSVEIGPPLRIGLITTGAVLGLLGAFRLIGTENDRFARGLAWTLTVGTLALLVALLLLSLAASE